MIKNSFNRLLLCAVLMAHSVSAQDFFVAQNGNDANPGTLESPFATIAHGLSVAQPGDSILVRNGMYHEKLAIPQSGNASDGYITLQNFNNEQVTISGQGVANNPASFSDDIIFIENKNYIKIIGLELRDIQAQEGSGIRIVGSGHHIELRNNVIHEIRGGASNGGAMGITVYGTNNTNSINNLIIDGNEIFDCDPAHSEALTLNGNIEQFEITNNYVHDVNNIGIDMIGGESLSSLAARDGICSGNRVVRARSSYGGGYAGGIYVDGGSNILVENNEVTECDLGIEVGAENPVIVVQNVIVQNNNVHHNDKVGIVFGGYAQNRGRVQNCIFRNNTLRENDTLQDGNGEFWVQWASNNIIEHNDVFSSQQNIMISSGNGNVGNTFNNNNYCNQDGIENARFIWQNTEYVGLEAFQNATGQELGATICQEPSPSTPQTPLLMLTPISSTQINLSWQDMSDNEEGFRIERSLDGQNYQIIAFLGANTTNYVDAGLLPNTQYHYRLFAFNTSGDSLPAHVDARTLEETDPQTPPNTPTLSLAALSTTQIELTWIDNSNNEDGFRIERRPDAETEYQVIAILGPNTTSFTDTNLQPNTLYHYRLFAFNTQGDSDPAHQDETTLADTPPIEPPVSPTLFLTAISSTQIHLNWLDNSDNEDGFRIERRRDDEVNYQVIATLNLNVTTFMDAGLVPETLYHYRLFAFNDAGDSPPAHMDILTPAIDPITPPNSPTLVANPISSTQISLDWIDNSNNEDGFRIERQKDGDNDFQVIAMVGPNETSYQDTNLEPNTLYHYRIFAINAAGDSVSSHADATTEQEDPPVQIPNTPSLILTPVSTTQINLDWIDNSQNEDGFRIERRAENESNYQSIATVGPNTTSFMDTDLQPNTLYHYQLFAFNTAGDSAPSHADAITLHDDANLMPPDAPTLMLTVVSSSQINLNWVDNATNEDGFRIERRTDNDVNYQIIATVGANETFFEDQGLEQNTLYHYRIFASNAAGDSDPSHADAMTLLENPSNNGGEFLISQATFIRGGRFSTNNYFNRNRLRVRGSRRTQRKLHSLLSFDLSVLRGLNPADIVYARVKLHTKRIEPGDVSLRPIVRIYSGNDECWQQGNVTWETAPESIDLLDERIVNQLGQTYCFEVTSFIKEKLAQNAVCNDRVSFRLEGKDDYNRRYVDFDAINGNNPPTMIIQLAQ